MERGTVLKMERVVRAVSCLCHIDPKTFTVRKIENAVNALYPEECIRRKDVRRIVNDIIIEQRQVCCLMSIERDSRVCLKLVPYCSS